MATRFYLPASGTPPTTITKSTHWVNDGNVIINVPAPKSKSNTAITTTGSGYVSTTYPHVFMAQFFTGQLAAYLFLTSDTLKIQIQAYAATAATCYLDVSVRVIAPDGSAVRGVLYEGDGSAFIVLAPPYGRNMNLGGSVNIQNQVQMQNGDRIVIEIGADGSNSSGQYVTLVTGDATATADLPEDLTTTTWEDAWIEFSGTIGDYSASSAPTVTTTTPTNVGQRTASGGGNVTADGGATITARGICWSTSANPTTGDSHTSESGTTGSYASSLTGLSPGTLYHVRAYATNSVGTSYGSDLQITTQPIVAPGGLATGAYTNTVAKMRGTIQSEV